MKSPTPPRVVTLTLHPAIDRVVKIDSMLPGATFNGREKLTVPAGKGVNTARVLRTLCGKRQSILSVVWAGEHEADFFRTYLREESGIECAVCPRPVRTRFAQTYLEADGRETHIKESMPPPSALERETRGFLEFWRASVCATRRHRGALRIRAAWNESGRTEICLSDRARLRSRRDCRRHERPSARRRRGFRHRRAQRQRVGNRRADRLRRCVSIAIIAALCHAASRRICE